MEKLDYSVNEKNNNYGQHKQVVWRLFMMRFNPGEDDCSLNKKKVDIVNLFVSWLHLGISGLLRSIFRFKKIFHVFSFGLTWMFNDSNKQKGRVRKWSLWYVPKFVCESEQWSQICMHEEDSSTVYFWIKLILSHQLTWSKSHTKTALSFLSLSLIHQTSFNENVLFESAPRKFHACEQTCWACHAIISPSDVQ